MALRHGELLVYHKRLTKLRLAQSAVFFALGHRKRGADAFAHLTPLKSIVNAFLNGQLVLTVPTESRQSESLAGNKEKSLPRMR